MFSSSNFVNICLTSVTMFSLWTRSRLAIITLVSNIYIHYLLNRCTPNLITSLIFFIYRKMCLNPWCLTSVTNVAFFSYRFLHIMNKPNDLTILLGSHKECTRRVHGVKEANWLPEVQQWYYNHDNGQQMTFKAKSRL